mmetsp:Transcript_18735/g.43377  ORF Transcript_18735/g.43377 Transcript_18735/m.43377 type:complete len:247 (+) Transcript_18735:132-872(+)
MRCYKDSLCLHSIVRRVRQSVSTTVETVRYVPVQSFSARTITSTSSPSSNTVSREDLLEEAAYLTKSLYRNCIRSVRLIRWGNAFDDKEFQRREEEFQNPTAGGVISMAPPPNKEDELQSRAEYYHSYTREYFTQESDCLENDPLLERDIRRYLYYLRKGEKDRKWLLGDMLFPDPYKNSYDQDRLKRFDNMSKKYFGEGNEEELGRPIFSDSNKQINPSSTPVDKDGFIEDDDPDWFQKKYPHLR